MTFGALARSAAVVLSALSLTAVAAMPQDDPRGAEPCASQGGSDSEKMSPHRSRPDCPGSATAVSDADVGQNKPAARAPERILGSTQSGLPWHSGAWVGGRFSAPGIENFGDWRGRPSDVVTTYSAKQSYEAIVSDVWPITTWRGFTGRLSFGLSILPESGEGSLESVAEGQQDEVWRMVALNLTANGRGNSIVRIAWESNLEDWRWQATAANAHLYRKAFRRVAATMKRQAPNLLFEFSVNCGTPLSGSADRLAPLTRVYPGDDAVDLIGCDIYDWYNTAADSNIAWESVLRPAHGPGIADVVDYARARGKEASFAEWGLAADNGLNNGGGDNPYFIEAMFHFFKENASLIAFECYFDEPDPYLKSTVQEGAVNPRASAAYAELW